HTFRGHTVLRAFLRVALECREVTEVDEPREALGDLHLNLWRHCAGIVERRALQVDESGKRRLVDVVQRRAAGSTEMPEGLAVGGPHARLARCDAELRCGSGKPTDHGRACRAAAVARAVSRPA